MNRKDSNLNDRIVKALSSLSLSLDKDGFIEPTEIRTVLKENEQLIKDAEARSSKFLYSIGAVNKDLKNNIDEIIHLYADYKDNVHQHNRKLAEQLSEDVGRMINPVEGRDLDRQQLSSIAMDVDTRLVIAGAGTGKTTTIVGFVKYLLQSGKANPDEILLLSFTNASVDELKERIQKETGKRIDTTTFHRLGLRIIASQNGKVPKISNMDINRFIIDEINRRSDNPVFLKDLNEYIAFESSYDEDEDSFTSYQDYIRYIEENPLITFKGERVKSFGEADIANYLALNGIEYVYEDPYIIDTTNEEHGQYHPDFHIKGTNIYIEYFGIDRNGNVAKFMSDSNPDASADYSRSMDWKRSIHKTNNTVLVSLYAYQRFEGSLLEILEKELIKLKINGRNISQKQIFSDFNDNDRYRIKSIASNFTTSILLIKGSGKDWDEIYPHEYRGKEGQHFKRLEKVLKPIFDSYQEYLWDRGEIDFEDMLNLASKCVINGYVHPYRYVIIDEYQDISRSRFRLLSKMRESKDYKLFCVGDDWQSIYRFNGSNVSYILDFTRYWGPSEVCKIETTYRFSGELLSKSSAFITRNPRQYKKELIGKGKECHIMPVAGKTIESAIWKLTQKLDELPKEESILFLGRYHHDIVKLGDNGFDWRPSIQGGYDDVVYRKRPELRIKFMTIHGSKGLQADYVFILNNRKGRYGFPSMRSEPIIIQKILGSQDTQIDEERRLFYVAMTRARKALYLLAVYDNQSPFYREVINTDIDDKDYKVLLRCPECGGNMIIRKGKFGEFYGCSNFHSRGCKYTIPISKENC